MTSSLEFTTPAKNRERRPIAVDLCGQELTVEHPKQTAMFFAQQVTASSASQQERAAAAWSFVESTLSPADRSVLMTRAMDTDDELNFNAVAELIAGLMERWDDWTNAPTGTLTIEATPSQLDLSPVEVTLDGDVLHCRPPKDLMLWIVMSALSDHSNPGQQAWGMGQLLDAVLAPTERIKVSDRLRDHDDDLDLDEIGDVADALIQHWQPEQQGNRAQRRAASKSSTAPSGGSKTGTGTGGGHTKRGASSARRAPARR